jgi:Zn-dependent peptidase ImmA (M78 family)
MNTTAIGNAFEEKIFDWFQAEIDANRFIAQRDYCRIFPKKGYYSKDRSRNIIFDIAIEIWMPGATTYSFLVLIECKKTRRPISADDVEEFFAKIQQVSAAAVKGIIATTSAFQDAALNFSESKRIGILRFYSDVDYKWELRRSSVAPAIECGKWDDVYRGIVSHLNRRRQYAWYCLFCGTYTNSICEFFRALAKDANIDVRAIAPYEPTPSAIIQDVQYLPSDQIESTCNTILKTIGYTERKVSLHSICDWQREAVGLTVLRLPRLDDQQNSSILGRLRFEPLEITVYSTGNEGRERFTLAHELGHHFLGHSRYMLGEYCDTSDVELRQPTIPGRDAQDIMRMEWQANHFASCLLLPEKPLREHATALVDAFDIHDRGFGRLFLDDQRCNRENFLTVTDVLMKVFGVSRTALTLRLQSLGILTDSRKEQQRVKRSNPIIDQ